VRSFYGVLQQEKAAQGAIITLGTFTPQARQWAKSNLLYLLDKKDFFEYLKRARTRK
jgi:restriction endonuclease Mrr